MSGPGELDVPGPGDLELVDGQAFRRAYEGLRQHVERRLGPDLRRHVDADDVIQEAFVLLAERAPSRRRVPESWLRRVAFNKVRDAVRYHGRDARRAVRGVGPDVLDGHPDRSRHGTPRALERVADRDEVRVVLRALRGLRREHAHVLLLRDVFRVSWTNVAAILQDRTVGAAQQLHTRARVDLARRLAGRARGGA